MGQIELATSRLAVRVDPERGASILGMSYIPRLGDAPRPVISREVPGEDPATKPACFIMSPWTNRVAGAAFDWQGKRHALRPSSADGTAIHGDVRSRPWTILDRTPVSARLRFESTDHKDVNYPWPFACEARYEVDDATLNVQVIVENTGTESVPVGCGLHPYFPRFFANGTRRVEISAGVTTRYPSFRNLPVGQARRDALCKVLARGLRAGIAMDDVFGGFGGEVVLRWDFTLRMRCSANLSHLVVYVPRKSDGGGEEPFIAVEPVTMVNDGFNLHAKGERGTGVVVLPPGERLETRTVFICEP